MTQQYLRKLSLIVAGDSGAGIELGDLRVVFEVRRGDYQTPNSCDVRVYNLSDSTANRISAPEFTQMQLKVGYQAQQLQLIFKGSIRQIRKGREDQKNSYLAITAGDADEAYNFSAMALTLAAGSGPQQGIKSIIANMARAASGSPTGGGDGQAVTQGYVPALTQSKLPRGRTYYGSCKDEMRDLAAANGCTWSIQDGQVTLIPLTTPIPGDPVLITPATGLIGVPEQTQNGLSMRVLLNSSIKIGQTIKLVSKDVNQFRYGLDAQSTTLNLGLASTTTKLNADGLYYVMRAEHIGDTRGNPWYTDLVCLAVDSSAPIFTQIPTAARPVSPSPQYPAIKQY